MKPEPSPTAAAVPSPRGDAASAPPLVTVITPVYNAADYLREGLESVQRQTIGRERIEHLLVNDGSTDGSGELLDRWAEEHADNTRVIHQEASGGPGGPRNRGLADARGEFVFFLDADDWIGDEALERMVAAARENGTDVVMGKVVGTNGRPDKKQAFVKHLPRTTVFDSYAFWSVGPWKLFRTSLLRDHGLRFPTDMLFGEDSVFVTAAFLHAGAISILTDYPYLHLRRRDDGGNVTALGTTDPVGAAKQWINTVDVTCETIRGFRLGPHQEGYLFKRLLHLQCKSAVRYLRRIKDPQVRAEIHGRIKDVVAKWATPATMRQLKPAAQVLYRALPTATIDEIGALAARFDDVAMTGVRGRVYAALPEWTGEGGAADFERWAVDVTELFPVRVKVAEESQQDGALVFEGHIGFAHVPKDRLEAVLVARLRGTATEVPVPVALDEGRFTAELPLEPLLEAAPGRGRQWDLLLRVAFEDYAVDEPLCATRDLERRQTAFDLAVRDEQGTKPVGQRYLTQMRGRMAIELRPWAWQRPVRSVRNRAAAAAGRSRAKLRSLRSR
ncbi:glycosyltransferase family 2 protein [Glycomyces sp. A-F 0318]|uniref:glycosyltransferase family 2 protein n=1 Tax=Glycomyces amatae TaxID=2881355 RepID=UPI001E5EEEA9|nr:glycosyltransferase family 2 protein [Glycomyces amatae]MCD0443738.1 glycosyltransferase family 2 protein [Glycomyces amatae]